MRPATVGSLRTLCMDIDRRGREGEGEGGERGGERGGSMEIKREGREKK